MTARKQSLLPKGSNYIILYTFNINKFFKHKKKNVFPEFDDKDVEDDDIIEDKEEEEV